MTADRENPVSRWSRLKQESKRRPGREGEAAVPGPETVSGELSEVEEPGQSEIVEQLPDIETLEEGSDFTVFLKEGVPDALRRRALRKLWRLNPVFANLDGLNDYDEDFTIVTTLAENLKTVYQVGKGMPDPEPVEETEPPEDQDVDRAGGGEIAGRPETEPTLREGAPDSRPVDPESGDGVLAENEEPGAMVSTAETREAEPLGAGNESAKKGSMAAHRRWQRFES